MSFPFHSCVRAVALCLVLALSGGAYGRPQFQGVVYYKKGDYLQTVNSLKKASAADASDNEATQILGLSFYLAGRPGEAVPYLERVQSWYQHANVDASYILGQCCSCAAVPVLL
jgi:tetratricopeptide (TPR) repeat protein